MKRQSSKVVMLLVLCFGLLGGLAHAQSFIQSYKTASGLDPGVIVKLVSSDTVTATSQGESSKMFGVVIPSSGATAVLSPSSGSGAVAYVSTSGPADVLVSSQGGEIKTGDYITISSLAGIGMKAGTNDPNVLGKATSNFMVSSQGPTTLTDSSGHHVSVQLGHVIVNIAIGKNLLYQPQTTFLPRYIINAANSIAHKPVSNSQVYLGLVVMIVGAFISGSLLYAAVRSSLVSIGRNPLSKNSIVRGLVQVCVVSIFIFVFTLFAVYLILKY